MNIDKIKKINRLIKNHQDSILRQQPPQNIPADAGRLSDDLSKVASSDVIGKGGESDLCK